MLLKEFKENMEAIISQSNSYLEWAGKYNELCQAYNLGTCGDDVFQVVFNVLETKLINETHNG